MQGGAEKKWNVFACNVMNAFPHFSAPLSTSYKLWMNKCKYVFQELYNQLRQEITKKMSYLICVRKLTADDTCGKWMAGSVHPQRGTHGRRIVVDFAVWLIARVREQKRRRPGRFVMWSKTGCQDFTSSAAKETSAWSPRPERPRIEDRWVESGVGVLCKGRPALSHQLARGSEWSLWVPSAKL